MDTRSKKFSAPLWAKAVACLLILVSCCVISLQVYEMAYRIAVEDYRPTLAKTYEGDSSTAWNTATTQVLALRVGCLLRSEQHVKEGGTLSQQRLQNYWISFFQEHIYDFVTRQARYYLESYEGAEHGISQVPLPDYAEGLGESYWNQLLDIYQNDGYDELHERWTMLIQTSDFQIEAEDGEVQTSRQGPAASGVMASFERYYQAQLESLAQQILEQDLRTLRYNLRSLTENQSLRYYVRCDGQLFSNVTESQLKEFEGSAISMKLEDRELTVRFGQDWISGDLESGYRSYNSTNWDRALPEDYLWNNVSEILTQAEEVDSAFIWFDQGYIKELQRTMEQNRKDTLRYGGVVLGLGLASLASLLYLFCACGRRKGEEGVRLCWVDMLYTELNLGLIALTVAGYIALFLAAWEAREPLLLWPIALVCGGVILTLLLSLVRRLKDRSLLRNCLIWKLILLLAAPFRKMAQAFRRFLHSGPYVTKAVWCTALYGVFCTICAIVFPLSILLIVLASIYVYRLALSFQKVQNGVTQVKNGNLAYQIDLSDNTAFNDLAADINSIADGLHAAVENELKSERMKSELITNVSHDIRTPLTSVITYIDLLQKEGLDSENAPGYCEIIGQKAQRLKNLTDDLFEVSKAASGNIAVNLTDVDLAALVRQGLGELDDKVSQSGLDFRVSLPAEGLMVRADGKLLWRVIENLLSNVFKYAMPTSRVYIDVQEQGMQAAFIMKNISAYELNSVDPEKLVERFQRGDTARHSEGNGLGLAIAKNLVELQKGNFEIVIDGDLFKASVSLPKGQARQPRKPEPVPIEPIVQPESPEQIG